MSTPTTEDRSLGALLGRDLQRLGKIKGWSPVRTWIEALCIDSGAQAVVAHRLAHAARGAGIPLLPALARRWSIALCGVDILPSAEIGGGLVIAHGLGLVVGGTTRMGRDCTLLHGVTLGEARFDELDCPTLGDRVTVGAGAIVLGGITVGDDALVGAGSVVLRDVPPGARVAGSPARVLDPNPDPETSQT
jgi:serine O-acetyltransferase